MNKSRKCLLLLLISLSMFACDQNTDIREIDLVKSERLIEYIDQLKISTLVLNDQNLIINDTLVLINPDSLRRPFFHEHQVSLEEWESQKKLPVGTMEKVLSLINESSNKIIVKEKEAYFFNEGGWIDSNFGKAYSKRQLKGKEDEFKFNRVQELIPIDERENWYTYYAD